ncbi:MAG: UDP-2,4-diacetamido-2,4,6-trideoxy-beta-L-altropyranose hydrolase [Rickettsiales bacterium]
MRFVFRVDSSFAIATGHVMRCAALADALRNVGADISFICKDLPGNVAAALEKNGFAAHYLPKGNAGDKETPDAPPHYRWLEGSWQDDAEKTAAHLTSMPEKPTLVVDHYALDARWEMALRPLVKKIVVIDDLADRPHDCDALIDHNLYLNKEERYRGLVPEECALLLGPAYALLRAEFDAVSPRLRRHVRRILVSFGGVDAAGMTLKAALALASLKKENALRDIAVDVVAGARNARLEEVRGVCEENGFAFFAQVNDMAERSAMADLSIGAGGVSALEHVILGLPSIRYVLAENQRRLIDDGVALGLMCAPQGDGDAMETHIAALLRDDRRLETISRSCMNAAVQGGCARLARRLTAPALTLSPATPADCRAIWELRNQEYVRRFSLSCDVIAWESHAAWYAAALHNPDRLIFVAREEGEIVGVLRYDLTSDVALVSVYLRESASGKGFGAEMLRQGEKRLKTLRPNVKTIEAQILPHNGASLALFARERYARTSTTFRKFISE